MHKIQFSLSSFPHPISSLFLWFPAQNSSEVCLVKADMKRACKLEPEALPIPTGEDDKHMIGPRESFQKSSTVS